jgi:hypothetical protein
MFGPRNHHGELERGTITISRKQERSEHRCSQETA